MLISENKSQFDKSTYPFSHFAELVSLRNDFVHPKHDRLAFYKLFPTQKRFEPIDYNKIPERYKSTIKDTDLVYRNTRIPKDPYHILPEHLDIAKKVVDDIIKELNRLLDGRVLKDDWIFKDLFNLVEPSSSKENI